MAHKTGDITSHYSAPELAELIRAANAVLKAQESTLLRVVTQVVSGKSRALSFSRVAPFFLDHVARIFPDHRGRNDL
jgi:hypothetical protein